MAAREVTSDRGNSEPMKFRYLFSLITWLFIAPVAMAITCANIAQGHRGWMLPVDGAFFGFAILALSARWFDHIFGSPIIRRNLQPGATASRDAATRYTILLVVIGVAAWLGAKLIASSGSAGGAL